VIPKFATSVEIALANFGIGTLAFLLTAIHGFGSLKVSDLNRSQSKAPRSDKGRLE